MGRTSRTHVWIIHRGAGGLHNTSAAPSSIRRSPMLAAITASADPSYDAGILIGDSSGRPGAGYVRPDRRMSSAPRSLLWRPPGTTMDDPHVVLARRPMRRWSSRAANCWAAAWARADRPHKRSRHLDPCASGVLLQHRLPDARVTMPAASATPGHNLPLLPEVHHALPDMSGVAARKALCWPLSGRAQTFLVIGIVRQPGGLVTALESP